MTPETLKEQKEQTQEQQQQTQQQQVQKEIEKLRKKILADGIVQQIYKKFRDSIANMHDDYPSDVVTQYLMQTKMSNYLYYIIKAYTAATYFKTSKVVKLLKQILTKLEKDKNNVNNIYDYIFDERLFFATVLAQIILERNTTLQTYIKAFYFYTLIKNLKASLTDKLKSDVMLDLSGLKEKAIAAIENEFIEKFENELVKEVEEKEENGIERINFENELKKEIKALKTRRKALRNYIINVIKEKIENEENFDKGYIVNLKKAYKNKRLARIYVLFKQLFELEQEQEVSVSDFKFLFDLFRKYTEVDIINHRKEAEEISAYLAQIQQ